MKVWFKYLITFVCLYHFSCKKSPQSEVLSKTFFSKIAKDSINYKVYVPHAKYNNKEPLILYLLHGHGGSEKDWFAPEYGNAKQLLDSITNIVQQPIIAVSIDAKNSWYVNSSEHQMESIYIDEFIPYFETTYSKSSAIVRLIAGNSAGGYGALRFTILHPELFRSTILLAPASYYPLPPELSSSRKINVFKDNGVFNDSIWQSKSHIKLFNNSKKNKKYPKIYLSTGDDDEYDIFNVVYDVRQQLNKYSIKNEVTIIDGKHSWEVWRTCFTNDLMRILNTMKD